MGRIYNFQDKDFVSVTTITELLAKPALYNFFAKHGLEKARQIAKASTDLGTSLHTYISEYWQTTLHNKTDQYQDVTFCPDLIKAIQNFHKFVEMYKPIPLLLETTVYHMGLGYAGTFDFVGWIRQGRKKSLVLGDWKSSGALYTDYHLQIEAYYQALTNSIKHGIITLELIKELDSLMLVRCGKEDEFNPNKDVVLLKPNEERFRAFTGLLDVYKWRQQERKTKKDSNIKEKIKNGNNRTGRDCKEKAS